MAISTITVTIPERIEKVWNVVVSLEDYAWRSDLSKIEVLEEGCKFVEVSKDGYRTTFTITEFDYLKRYEFDIVNDNMIGHWSGIFSTDESGTKLIFSEDVTAKKLIMKPLIGLYLKKQQHAYMEDLKKVFNS